MVIECPKCNHKTFYLNMFENGTKLEVQCMMCDTKIYLSLTEWE